MLERIHLAIVREVSRTGTLTQTAAHLHLTQSALSHAVKKLEQQSGVQIWTKEGRRLRLTQAGEYLLALANRLLPQLEHTELLMRQVARGQRGTLRVGMECHPCYQWLLKVVAPFLKAWPQVDIDVRQEFQFGGIGALYHHDVDLLITPDPLLKKGLSFTPVFDYELVLVVGRGHPLAHHPYVEPSHLSDEVLITYPVEPERLDIYHQFLAPANAAPKQRKIIETTDIMLQMVAVNRGVSALPHWLVQEYAGQLPLHPLRLGRQGIHKQIFVGTRSSDSHIDYIKSFVALAREQQLPGGDT